MRGACEQPRAHACSGLRTCALGHASRQYVRSKWRHYARWLGCCSVLHASPAARLSGAGRPTVAAGAHVMGMVACYASAAEAGMHHKQPGPLLQLVWKVCPQSITQRAILADGGVEQRRGRGAALTTCSVVACANFAQRGQAGRGDVKLIGSRNPMHPDALTCCHYALVSLHQWPKKTLGG